MASKSSQPALYEKLRGRSIPRGPVGPLGPFGPLGAPASKIDVMPASPPMEVAASWLRPGRVVRIPVGYVLLAVALAILLAVVAYITGHNRGEMTAKQTYEQEFRDAIAGSDAAALAAVDPLVDSLAEKQRPSQGTDSARGSAANAGGPASWGPVVPKTDPRRKGLNYFVLAETTESGAVRLAEYCRSQGLETYVVLINNSQTRRRVIAFPGFEASQRGSPEVKRLESMIHAIGEKWKRTQRGETDLHDAYPRLHSG